MSKRKLPSVHTTARPGMRTEITTKVLDRWNPGLQAASDDETLPTISILDPIGEDFWGDGVSAKRIAAALRSVGDRDVVVNINSPGGDFFEGLAIYNLLREHPGAVTVKILGVAASAAALIAMAGDEITIARAGFFMIHNTWVVGMGDRHGLRELADWLEPFDQASVDVFAARTGMANDELVVMLDKETWIGGNKAVEQGFADGLLASDEIEGGAQNSAASKPLVAQHKIDTLLAKAGVSRTERRELVASLKGVTPGADLPGMQDAAVAAEAR
ncbi:MAG: Clp protease ClpP, partial [Rhodobacteraceae bacterium]|nr:Clp protease ClpP [Paracoccaceae bacterium]